MLLRQRNNVKSSVSDQDLGILLNPDPDPVPKCKLRFYFFFFKSFHISLLKQLRYKGHTCPGKAPSLTENSSNMKISFFIFLGKIFACLDLDSQSGSGSTDPSETLVYIAKTVRQKLFKVSYNLSGNKDYKNFINKNISPGPRPGADRCHSCSRTRR